MCSKEFSYFMRKQDIKPNVMNTNAENNVIKMNYRKFMFLIHLT